MTARRSVGQDSGRFIHSNDGTAGTACPQALSAALSQAETPPEKIETTAEVEVRTKGADISIPRIKLTVRAKVPGIDDETFQKAANDAKEGCPVSKALAGVETIELDATLEES